MWSENGNHWAQNGCALVPDKGLRKALTAPNTDPLFTVYHNIIKGGFAQSKTDILFATICIRLGCFKRQLSNTTPGNVELLIKFNRIKRLTDQLTENRTSHYSARYFTSFLRLRYIRSVSKHRVMHHWPPAVNLFNPIELWSIAMHCGG